MLGRIPKAFPIHYLPFFNASEFIPWFVIVLQHFSAAVLPAFMQGLSNTLHPRPLAGFQMVNYIVPRGCTERVFASPAISTLEHSVLRIPFPVVAGPEAILETSTDVNLVQSCVGFNLSHPPPSLGTCSEQTILTTWFGLPPCGKLCGRKALVSTWTRTCLVHASRWGAWNCAQGQQDGYNCRVSEFSSSSEYPFAGKSLLLHCKLA